MRLENLPPVGSDFLIHDEAGKSFEIVESSDWAYIGVYDGKIVSSFQQMDIERNLVTVSAEIDFRLVIKPCLVESFEVVERPEAQILYTLGEETFSFGPYSFE